MPRMSGGPSGGRNRSQSARGDMADRMTRPCVTIGRTGVHPLDGPSPVALLRRLRGRRTICVMRLAPLIRWIDREWDKPPNATCSLGLILLAVWFPLMLIGWNAVTLTLGAVWTVPWIALYGWRLVAMVDRLDAKFRKKKRR